MKYNIGDLLEYTRKTINGTHHLLIKNVIEVGHTLCYEFMNLTNGYDVNVAVSTVDAEKSGYTKIA